MTRGVVQEPLGAVKLNAQVSGGVEFPFSAVCRVNRETFSGVVRVTWERQTLVPEYGHVEHLVRESCWNATTCEELAIRVRQGLNTHMRRMAETNGATVYTDRFSVRVDVTNEGHPRAWAVA